MSTEIVVIVGLIVIGFMVQQAQRKAPLNLAPFGYQT